MIIGGSGNYWGQMVGAIILALSQHLAIYYWGSEWMDAISFIILIIFLYIKPTGFSREIIKKVEV